MTGSNETRPLRFPLHNEPRVWLLTSGTSPIAVALTRQLHLHGDYVAIGVGGEDSDGDYGRSAELRALLEEVGEEGRARIKVLNVDIRNIQQCQAGVAETIKAWGKIDILLCCTSEAVVGTTEELSRSPETLALVRDQFETNFFGPVNIIKAVLLVYRAQRTGHILILTGITGHIGTPGLGMYCASSWALEGFCDSLAYEIAPFNIKMTIIQPNMEVSILTNKITFTPSMPEYSSYTNPAPSVREILSNTFHSAPSTKIDNQDDSNPSRATTQSRLNGTNSRNRRNSTSSTLTGDADAENPQHDRENNNDNDEPLASALYPSLSPATQSALVNETIHALIAVGGHENPPARHIVGHEGVASVKEKLKTVSEELEDFVEVSGAVDIVKEEERPITGSQTATSGTGAGPNLTSLRGTD